LPKFLQRSVMPQWTNKPSSTSLKPVETSANTISSSKDVYEIEREYAKGGMGVTFLVKSRKTGQRLILKQLRMDRVGDWKMVELFEREAEVLRKLNHVQIPKYVDYFPSADKKNFNLVQSFIEGQTLQQMIDQNSVVTQAEFNGYLGQTLQILVYLHALVPPVVHRDISPKNIIINRDKAYLVDFGAVKSAIASDTPSFSTTVGTFGYMPPEQIMGQAEPASDMYSLGMSFIALATHTDPTKLPLNKQSGQVDIQKIFKEPLTPAQKVLAAMTRMGLQERLGRAVDAIAILSGKGGSDGAAIMSVTLQRKVPVFKTLVILGLVALAVIFLRIYYYVPPPPPEPLFGAEWDFRLTSDDVEQLLLQKDWRGKCGDRVILLSFYNIPTHPSGHPLRAMMSFSDGLKMDMDLSCNKYLFDLYGQRNQNAHTIYSHFFAGLRYNHASLYGKHEIRYVVNGIETNLTEDWSATSLTKLPNPDSVITFADGLSESEVRAILTRTAWEGRIGKWTATLTITSQGNKHMGNIKYFDGGSTYAVSVQISSDGTIILTNGRIYYDVAAVETLTGRITADRKNIVGKHETVYVKDRKETKKDENDWIMGAIEFSQIR